MDSSKPSMPATFSNPVAAAAEVAKAARAGRFIYIDASKATDEDAQAFLDAYALLKEGDPSLPDVYVNPR